LTITPDQDVYQVGDTITLDIVGDAQGAADAEVSGRLLFDAALAEYVSSSQVALESSGGFWNAPPSLSGGEGFAHAFNQFTSPFGFEFVPENLLLSTVVLRATDVGVLDYEWATDDGNDPFRFFGLTDAPGGSVTIVPEPASCVLLGLGLAAIAVGRRARRRNADARSRIAAPAEWKNPLAVSRWRPVAHRVPSERRNLPHCRGCPPMYFI
jgi:hypothetical protein